MPQHNNTQLKYLWGVGISLLCFVLVLPTLRLPPAGAQSSTSPETAKDQELDSKIRSFFESLVKGNTSSAFDDLLRQSPLGNASASSQTAELRSQTDEMKNQFGEILDWEKYETKQIGEDVVVLRYILKCEHYPVIWTFTFYRKPSVAITMITNPWVLVELHFDSNLL